jgi:hypothetical protein
MFKQTPLARWLGLAAVIVLSLTPVFAMTEHQKQSLHSAALEGRQMCLKEMHHDTDEFVDCINGLLAQEKNLMIGVLAWPTWAWSVAYRPRVWPLYILMFAAKTICDWLTESD